MRFTKLSKILTLAGFGLGSLLFGYFAINRNSPARSVLEDPATVIETTELREGASALPADVGKTYPTAATYGTRKPLVTFDGDVITIDATASIRDTRPNLGYVWAVQVFMSADAGHEFPVFEHWFEGQIVEVKGNESVNVSILEQLPTQLLPGDYRVIVGAYRIQPTLGVENLKTIPVSRLLKQAEGPCSGTLVTLGL